MERKEGGKIGAWTSAAMVVLEAPKNNGQQGWERTTTRPALVRVTNTLPQHIGTTEINNGHGELLALCMAQEVAPKGLPIVIITDSAVERGRTIKMRNGSDNMLTRHKIRKVFGGTSKCLAMRMDKELKKTE